MSCLPNEAKVHESQFNINTRNLEICNVQGPSLLKSDPVHPLVDKNVIIRRGPLKGLYGHVKDVRSVTLTIELEAKVAGSKYLCQPFKWNDIRFL